MLNKRSAAKLTSEVLEARDLGELAHSLIYGTESESKEIMIGCAIIWGTDAVKAFVYSLTGGAVG